MRCFRATHSTYDAIQQAVDEAFRAEYIDTGRCEHILPVDLAPMADGKCYLALPEWMTSHPNAAQFVASVEEITEAQYLAATQPAEEAQ